MSHLTRDQLSALLDGALPERDRAERHLEACEACRAELATLAEADRVLAASLEHDPGEHYFEGFADRVAERIAAEASGLLVAGRAVAAAGARPRRTFMEWLTTPRGLAWAGSAAAVVVVAGIAWMQFENARMPMSNSEIASRADQVAPAAPPLATESLPAAPYAAKEAAPAPADDRLGALGKDGAPIQDELRENAAAPSPAASAVPDVEVKEEAGAALDARALESNERADQPATERTADRDAASARQRRVRPTARGEDAIEPPARKTAPAPTPPPAATMAAPQQQGSVESSLKQLQRAAEPLGTTESAQESAKKAQGFAQPPSGGAASTFGGRVDDKLRKRLETRTPVWPAIEPPPRAQAARWPEATRPLVTRADQAERLAPLDPRGVVAHDEAAALWEQVLAAAPVGALRVEAALHVAWTRYQAYRRESTDDRREAARTAAERYVDLAPEGPMRERYREAIETLR